MSPSLSITWLLQFLRGHHSLQPDSGIKSSKHRLGVRIHWPVRFWSVTQRQDGTRLTGLAGYRIPGSRKGSGFIKSVRIGNANVTRYKVDNLMPVTWWFAATAID